MDIRTELPKLDVKNAETGCCPRFDPAPWDDAVFDLNKFTFMGTQTKSFMYVPVNMGSVFTKAMKTIDDAGAVDPDRYLILSRDLSPWKAEHHFLVTKDVPGMPRSDLAGKYYARVYEGPFKDMPRWMADFSAKAAAKGASTGAVYAFYTTCPKCAKAYGKNYVVLFGRLA